MKQPFLPVIYGAVLLAFTGYVMLDTFLLPTVQQEGTTEMNLSMFEENASAETAGTIEENAGTTEATEAETSGKHHRSRKDTAVQDTTEATASSAAASAVGTDRSYQDENISITVSEYYENDTKIYVADVQLTSAQYLKTAFANNTYGKNVTAATSEIAAANNAILAINGDFYGAQETGYVIRNGVVYRDTGKNADILCIYADGHFEITSSSEATAQELAEAGVWQAFSFGPGLVEDGSVTVSAGDEVGRAMASNPRTAIGMIDPLHYVFVVSDGRTEESAGLSLLQLAEFLQSLGVQTAYNLDGGGSSTMYWQGQVINNPTTSGRSTKERSVSDIVYIGT